MVCDGILRSPNFSGEANGLGYLGVWHMNSMSYLRTVFSRDYPVSVLLNVDPVRVIRRSEFTNGCVNQPWCRSHREFRGLSVSMYL